MRSGQMAELTTRASLIVVGAIHLIPALGVTGTDRLRALYGVEVAGADLLILMQHRAVLFGILGVLLLASAFMPSSRWIAIWSGGVSVASFLCLALSAGDYNERIGSVVLADLAALALLLVAAAAHASARPLRGGAG